MLFTFEEPLTEGATAVAAAAGAFNNVCFYHHRINPLMQKTDKPRCPRLKTDSGFKN